MQDLCHQQQVQILSSTGLQLMALRVLKTIQPGVLLLSHFQKAPANLPPDFRARRGYRWQLFEVDIPDNCRTLTKGPRIEVPGEDSVGNSASKHS